LQLKEKFADSQLPPVPPKPLIGIFTNTDKEFIKERTVALEKYQTRRRRSKRGRGEKERGKRGRRRGEGEEWSEGKMDKFKLFLNAK
jgi:hypothetical protein